MAVPPLTPGDVAQREAALVVAARPALSSAALLLSQARPALPQARPALSSARPALSSARPALSQARPALSPARLALASARPALSQAKPAHSPARLALSLVAPPPPLDRGHGRWPVAPPATPGPWPLWPLRRASGAWTLGPRRPPAPPRTTRRREDPRRPVGTWAAPRAAAGPPTPCWGSLFVTFVCLFIVVC